MFVKVLVLAFSCLASVTSCFRNNVQHEEGMHTVLFEAAAMDDWHQNSTQESLHRATPQRMDAGAMSGPPLPTMATVRAAASFAAFAVTTPEGGFPLVMIGGFAAVMKDGYTQYKKKHAGKEEVDVSQAADQAALDQQAKSYLTQQVQEFTANLGKGPKMEPHLAAQFKAVQGSMRAEMAADRARVSQALASKVAWIDATVVRWQGQSIGKEERAQIGSSHPTDYVTQIASRAAEGGGWAWLIDVPAAGDTLDFQGTKLQQDLKSKLDESLEVFNWAVTLYINQQPLAIMSNDPLNALGLNVQLEFKRATRSAVGFADCALLYPAILSIGLNARLKQNAAKMGGIYGKLF